MTTVAVLQTDLILNSAAFRTGMVQAAATANSTLGSIRDQAASTASSLSLLSKAAVGLFAFDSIKEGVNALVEAQVQLQQIHYTLITATGSASAADAAFGYLRETSAKLGLNLQPASQAFGQLAASAEASGISMDATKQLFEAYGEASTTLHLSTEQSNHALLALTEMMSRGTINARQLNQQLGFAIPGSAARFKAAVMEAVKGTDLQGESFNKLMEGGKLVTAQFLPQLIQALQETGRGWEDAAGGLNAQLNRLKTSWFDLKTEVSGGLFNDVATNGVAFMATNLERVASAVALVAGVGIARLVGQGLQTATNAVASPITRYQQESVGAKMAADAERDYTAQILANTEARAAQNTMAKEAAAAALADAQARRVEAFDIKAAALAEMERIEAAMALNETLGTGAAAQRTQAELEARLATVSATLGVAEKQLTYQLVIQDAARATLMRTEKAEAALRAEVAAASEAFAASETAVAVAAGEGGVAGALAKAGSSLGKFALALVGGPWGAAALAIGAIGYAIYDAYEQGVKWDEQTKNDVKSLEQVTQSAKDAAEAYGQLGSSMTAVQALDTLKGVNQEVSKQEDAIKALQDQLRSVKSDYAFASQSGSGGMKAAADSAKIGELTSRIAELQAKLPQAEQAVQGLSSKLVGALTPAVDGLKNAIDRLKSGGSIMDAINALASQSDVDKAVQGIVKAQTAANNAMEAIDSLAASAHKKSLTKGQSYLDQAQVEAQLAVEAIKKEHLTAADEAKAISDVQDELAKKKADLISGNKFEKDRAAATAAREQQQAYESLIATVKTRIEQDKEAENQTRKLTAAQALQIKVEQDFASGKSKLSKSEQDYVRALLDTAVKQGEATKAAEQKAMADKNLLNLQRQLADESERQARANATALAGIGHGSQWATEAAAIGQITAAYQRRKEAADRAYADDVRQNGPSIQLDQEHARAIGTINDAYDAAKAAQQKFYAAEKVAQGNWKNGAKTAFENFRDSAANVAGATATLFDNAFSGMTDALTTFVTTGKLNFKSMVTSILTDLARMELRIVESKILSSILGAFMPAAAGGGLSNIGALAGNGSTVGGFSGYGMTLQGGRASGGPVSAGSMYRVNENGPELLTTGGSTYLMMGAQDGRVTPNRGGSGGSSGQPAINVTIQTVIQGNGTQSTQSQGSGRSQLAKQLGEEVKGVVNRELVRQSQPNGLLWKLMRGQTA